MRSVWQAVGYAAPAAEAAADGLLLNKIDVLCGRMFAHVCLLCMHRTWIYPYSTRREYQFKAAWRLISSNSMVCFPTGTGKTLIAAVVMYNYYRWFPKVCFTYNGAPQPITLRWETL